MTASTALIILCYHSIDDSGSLVSVTPAQFARHMAYLSARRVRAVSLESALEDPGTEGRMQVALTFDDAYRNLLSVVHPILLSHGFSATVYLPTAYAGSGASWLQRDFAPLFEEGGNVARQRAAIHARIPAYGAQPDAEFAHTVARMRRIPALELLSWDEIRVLQRAGIRFGSHSAHHCFLTTLDDAALDAELADSRDAIEHALGSTVRTFCYPYGDYDARVRARVAAHGYRAAVTTHPGVSKPRSDDWLALPRVSIDARCDLFRFAAYLTPPYGWYTRWRWGKVRG